MGFLGDGNENMPGSKEIGRLGRRKIESWEAWRRKTE
jgi:hypothetical protein